MANLLRVRTVVQQTLAKQDSERTNQFLHAASSGDVAKIRQVGLIPLKESFNIMPQIVPISAGPTVSTAEACMAGR